MKKIASIILVCFLSSFNLTFSETTLPSPTANAEDLSNEFGQIVWYNLITPDIEESKTFYKSILDWKFEDINVSGQKFALIKHNNVAIGSILEVKSADASIWLASVSVSNIDEIIKRYTDNGGRFLIEPFNVGNTGKQVILEGPLGEKIAYINNPASPVSLTDNGPNQWIWTELWSNDAEISKTFYEKVWNVEVTSLEIQNQPYWYFEKDNQKVAGMINNPAEGTNSQWVPYLNISDIYSLNETLKASGVNIMLEPQETESGMIMVFQDPHGATLSAQNYSK